ncbi:unnamed protein product [Prorocentrum cordatum]|uniref:Uncharacterized protein n=1 Tax=Prorocentrum cordatum TaxID=2364126 RepID=A0ABN9XZV1_9DINO|nr:unnamed protein product [Polarella glacialis]
MTSKRRAQAWCLGPMRACEQHNSTSHRVGRLSVKRGCTPPLLRLLLRLLLFLLLLHAGLRRSRSSGTPARGNGRRSRMGAAAAIRPAAILEELPAKGGPGELGNFELIGQDVAADLVANLKEMRQESVEGAEEAGTEMVAMDVDHLKAELEALAWMRQEVAARAAEAELLRRENEELRAQRDEFREHHPELFDDAGSGDSSIESSLDTG